MVEIDLIRAASAARRLEGAAHWLRQRDARTGALVLAPTRDAADDFVREYFPSAFGVHRASVLQFATELVAPTLAERGLAPISTLGREALAARCIAEVADRGTFVALGPVERSPGLPRALASTIQELRLFDLQPPDLSACGGLSSDLADLLKTFRDELHQRSLVDAAEIYRIARGVLEGCRSPSRHQAIGLPLILLDISPQSLHEQEFFRRLIAASSAAIATIVTGDRRAEQAYGADPTRSTEEPTESVLDRIRHSLFRPQRDSSAISSTGELDFFAAPGEGRECVEIVRAIQESGVNYDRIAVALRKPEIYSPLLEEAFARADIPLYFSRGTVRPHSAGRAFLALLTCADENLSASRFAEYLSLGQVPRLSDEGRPPEANVPWVAPTTDQLVFVSDGIDHQQPAESHQPAGTNPPDRSDRADQKSPAIAGTLRVPRRWEKLLVDAAVVGGRERWRDRLRGLDNEIRLQIRELDRDPEADDRREILDLRLELLGNLQRFALPIIDQLDRLPSIASWDEWIARLEDLASRTLRDPEQVLEMLAELRLMEDVDGIGLSEVLRVLSPRLRSLPAPRPEGGRYGRVLIAGVDECRGRSFELVFLPGLAEGMFPARSFEDPLLLDAIKSQLPAELPTSRDKIADERLRLRIAVGAARHRLVFSYPNLDALQGRSRVPSFYALDLLRARDGVLPSLADLEAESQRDALLGWPAPNHPSRAIDDAEYDLAVLAPLLRSGERGGARYLLATNESLRRSLRSRYRRWRRSFSHADGIVNPDENVVELLEQHRLTKRSYSPTSLQRFAACPYQFLLQAIHRLRPRETIAAIERLDPLTRGSIFHQVQFELFTELDELGLLPMRSAHIDTLAGLADQILDRCAKRFYDQLCPAIPRVWDSEIEALRIDLQGWIRVVIEGNDNWRPERFELAFGLPSSTGSGDPHREDESFEAASILDGFLIRGAIDVVERDLESDVLRITDHKTGKTPTARNLTVGGGEILQPLLYALAAEQLLAASVESGRLFYATRRGDYRSLKVPLDNRGRQEIERVLSTIDRSIASGFLPAAPRQRKGWRAGACTYCDYQVVCGPLEELRTREKSRQRLIPLNDLRAMP